MHDWPAPWPLNACPLWHSWLLGMLGPAGLPDGGVNDRLEQMIDHHDNSIITVCTTWARVPWDQNPFHWHLSSHLKGVLLPHPSSLSLSRWASTTDPGQASPSFPSSQDHSTGPHWVQKETSLKVRSMNRARSCGTRARKVRGMEVSVLPGAAGLDWAQAKKLDPKRSQSTVKKFLKQSSWWHLQFGISFGQWQSSLYREVVYRKKTGP